MSDKEFFDSFTGLSDFDRNNNTMETCSECHKHVKADTTLDWLYSFWSTPKGLYVQKCTDGYHHHQNIIKCVHCCAKDKYQKNIDHQKRLNEFNTLVKMKDNGKCKHCRSKFSSNHKEHDVCHTCYGRFCTDGFYESPRQYQYKFSTDKSIIEKFMICKICWDDSVKKNLSVVPTWTPDADVTHCQYDGCTRTFGYIFGDSLRHHCRGCGIIICSTHCKTSYIAYNNQPGNTCPTCFEQANVTHKG